MTSGPSSNAEAGVWHVVLDRAAGRIRSLGGEAAGPLAGPAWGGVRLQLRSFAGLELIDCTTLRHTLLMPVQGGVEVMLSPGRSDEPNAGGISLSVGSIGFLTEGESFRMASAEPFQMLGMTIDPAYVQVASGGRIEAGGLALRSRVAVSDDLLMAAVPLLYRELVSSGEGTPYADALTASVALRLASEYRAAEGEEVGARVRGVPFLIRKAVSYIHERIAEEITLEQLARHVGQSSFHFARAFKDAMGFAPHQYLIRLRVERAKQLLISGRRSPAEVAGDVGFCDQSHLTRHFKRITGTTPSQFLMTVSGRGRYTRRKS